MKVPFARYFYCHRLFFCGTNAEDVLNFALENKLNFWGYNKADQGFTLFLSHKGRTLLSRNEPLFRCVREERACGLFPFLFRHKGRSGLAFGALVALFFLFATSNLVWDIRIEGNERYSTEHLRQSFSEHGLSIGTPISGFDRTDFASSYLRGSEELSFLAVNFRGSVAYVQVMERLDFSDDTPKTGGANLVASQDAVVESLSVTHGDPLVGAGTVVHAGQLLVSGVMQGAAGSSFVYAEGEIWGRVKHTLTVEVPLEQIEKNEIDLRLQALSLNFFGKEINIFTNAGNCGELYDTIYKKKSFYVTESCRLPVFVNLAYAATYAETGVRLSEGETVAYATRRMNESLSLFLRDKELLSKRLSGAFVGDTYVLTCEMECLENIAATQEFSVG